LLHQRIEAAQAGVVSLPEVIGAFSYALDITEGQPAGHCIRACWIGTRLGRMLGLAECERHDLHYMLLLKDLGCSSNSARICELYDADDRAFKQGYKTVGTGLAATLHFVFSRTAAEASFPQRAKAIAHILRNGGEIAQELITARCTRGSEIARTLRFSEAVCEGIYHLDEHWDGSGRPDGLMEATIPLPSRIALLAQVADVFHRHAGRTAAVEEVRRRAASWLDPELVRLFKRCVAQPGFWETLESPLVEQRVASDAPAVSLPVDEDYLDSIAAAFGQVVDAKSPYTAGHSRRVADLAATLGSSVGVPAGRIRWLRRAALLHDIGKLGVSNKILDKPGGLDDREWSEMRDHAVHTQAILGRIGALTDLAPVAAAHHERLDGAGYPLGLAQSQITLETRVITVCDFYDALTSDRPYRRNLATREALGIMAAQVGHALDERCFEALRACV